MPDTNEQRDPVKEARELLARCSRIHALADHAHDKDEDVSWLIETLCGEVNRLRAQQEHNRLSKENVTLRTQNQTQAESITYFQENERKLKAQLVQAQTGLREQRETIKFWQRHITRMGEILGTIAMDTEVEAAVKALKSKLAQVEQERNGDNFRVRAIDLCKAKAAEWWSKQYEVEGQESALLRAQADAVNELCASLENL